MPKRKTAAKKSPTRKLTSAAASFSSALGFQVGDVVLDAADPTRIGTVCRVLDPGLSYRVRFADDTQCNGATQSSLMPAPPGNSGPACTADC